MRILVGKTFGIGNCVMAVPLIKALSTLGLVDVLIGNTPDDSGAHEVFSNLQLSGEISEIHVVNAMTTRYDVAVMAIPFDGRWKNGVHYNADLVLDSRPRPEFSSQLGFSSWKKHEVEYQMESAYQLGYQGEIPSMSFLSESCLLKAEPDTVYLGLGFKRDADSFWSRKHWGNSRYVAFIKECQRLRPTIKFRSTGRSDDLLQTIWPIARDAGVNFGMNRAGLKEAFSEVQRCHAYFGNDTGMMHVAASEDLPTFGLMAYENVGVKNRPWCSRWMTHDFSSGGSDPDSVAKQFIDFVWGD